MNPKTIMLSEINQEKQAKMPESYLLTRVSKEANLKMKMLTHAYKQILVIIVLGG